MHQKTVALFLENAEYVSSANAAQEIAWSVKLLEGSNLPQKLEIVILEDNQSFIKLTKSYENKSEAKI